MVTVVSESFEGACLVSLSLHPSDTNLTYCGIFPFHLPLLLCENLKITTSIVKATWSVITLRMKATLSQDAKARRQQNGSTV